MTQLVVIFLWLLFYAHSSLANVEKIIFLGPSSLAIATAHPTLEDLKLHALTPQQETIRIELRAEFPPNVSANGEASWVLLHHLSEGQRYELRICWAATQPTNFRLYAYELAEVFDSVELITSLANYSMFRLAQIEALEDQMSSVSRSFKMSDYGSSDTQSVLLIQVLAAADYYTTNRTLMEHVPPVLVDIILDPYLLNIFPRSLVPTGAYLLLVSILSWYLAKIIAKWLQVVARTDEQKKQT